jgi:hypothetical protein
MVFKADVGLVLVGFRNLILGHGDLNGWHCGGNSSGSIIKPQKSLSAFVLHAHITCSKLHWRRRFRVTVWILGKPLF